LIPEPDTSAILGRLPRIHHQAAAGGGKKVKKIKKSFQDRIDDMGLESHYYLSLMTLTKTYKEFKKSLPSKIKLRSLRLRGNHYEALKSPCLDAWHCENDLLRMFYNTPKGKFVAGRGLEPKQRAISYNKIIQYGKFLEMRIDLTASKEQLRQEFEWILTRNHSKVEQSLATKGPKLLNFDEIDEAIKYFKLVKKYNGNFLKSMRELFPETKDINPSYDEEINKLYQKLRRLYLRVEADINSLEFPFINK